MSLPTQQQLLFPLLEQLRDLGGSATPADVYDSLARRLELSQEERTATIAPGSNKREWDRTLRWTQQKAKLLGYVSNERFGRWDLTSSGRDALHQIAPGAIITVFETEYGVALCAEASAAVKLIEHGQVRLIPTSPPYPLLDKKAYANQHAAREHVDWLVSEISQWTRPLADDGSIILNLGDTWQRGQPTLSTYQERLILRLCDELGLVLAQRLYWHNPTALPRPAEWVNVRRVRVKPAVEQLYWLAKTPHPFANNRAVLRPYSDAMRQRLAAGGEARASRPSGFTFRSGAFSNDNGGSIPDNLLAFPNSASRDRYALACKAQGLPQHPARFPVGLIDWLVRLLTEPGDIVWDPFGGSSSVGEACERLGRHWITSEKAAEYAIGAAGRFAAPSLKQHFTAAQLT